MLLEFLQTLRCSISARIRFWTKFFGARALSGRQNLSVKRRWTYLAFLQLQCYTCTRAARCARPRLKSPLPEPLSHTSILSTPLFPPPLFHSPSHGDDRSEIARNVVIDELRKRAVHAALERTSLWHRSSPAFCFSSKSRRPRYVTTRPTRPNSARSKSRSSSFSELLDLYELQLLAFQLSNRFPVSPWPFSLPAISA
ncbi:hypothetical protein C8R45DRAFT_359986 [Mycena sanguinolenta]|nr:hypothetical protein C8R45DRAFT_359986 [Mycena sanguinolenta]